MKVCFKVFVVRPCCPRTNKSEKERQRPRCQVSSALADKGGSMFASKGFIVRTTLLSSDKSKRKRKR